MPASNLLCLDVGSVRVGVAMATHGLRVARPIETLERTAEDFWDKLSHHLQSNQIDTLVIGLPRSLDGEDTQQTDATRQFQQEVSSKFPDLQIEMQDEALTSEKAKAILEQRGGTFDKSEVDAVAASVILDDYLAEQETMHEKV